MPAWRSERRPRWAHEGPHGRGIVAAEARVLQKGRRKAHVIIARRSSTVIDALRPGLEFLLVQCLQMRLFKAEGLSGTCRDA